MRRLPKRWSPNRRGWLAGVFVGVVLVGCSESPMTPEEALWEGDGSLAVAESVGASWGMLVSREGLEIETFEALALSGGAPEVDQFFIDAGNFVVEAEYARFVGDAESVLLLEQNAGQAYLGAAIVVLGPNLVSGAIAGADTVLTRVEKTLRTRAPSIRMTAALNRARSRIAEARTGLARGDSVEALEAAVAAAAELRELNPEARARAAVGAASALLERAIEIAGPDPRPEIVDALREAKDHCDTAGRSLDAGEWEKAISEAKLCWQISRKVIAVLAGEIHEDRLEVRAHEVVAKATDLYERAVEVAGDNASPAVQRGLEHAHDLLQKARVALGEGDYREAIRFARESASLSRRILDALTGGGRPILGDVTILPYPIR